MGRATNIETDLHRIRLRSEPGCVENQPRHIASIGGLKSSNRLGHLHPLRIELRSQPRSVRREHGGGCIAALLVSRNLRQVSLPLVSRATIGGVGLTKERHPTNTRFSLSNSTWQTLAKRRHDQDLMQSPKHLRIDFDVQNVGIHYRFTLFPSR